MFFFSSLVLLIRGEGWQENMLKMAVFPLMQSVPCFEEKLKLYFLKNVMTSVFELGDTDCRERESIILHFCIKKKKKKEKKFYLNTKKSFHEVSFSV